MNRRRDYLCTFWQYELGRLHQRDGVSDFHRRRFVGDERDAYMLGRRDERVAPLLERIREKTQ
jgi:hypothetical protein